MILHDLGLTQPLQHQHITTGMCIYLLFWVVCLCWCVSVCVWHVHVFPSQECVYIGNLRADSWPVMKRWQVISSHINTSFEGSLCIADHLLSETCALFGNKSNRRTTENYVETRLTTCWHSLQDRMKFQGNEKALGNCISVYSAGSCVLSFGLSLSTYQLTSQQSQRTRQRSGSFIASL